MSRMTPHGVETMLRTWADAQVPVASPALASFMGPLLPLPAFSMPAGQLGGSAAQAGITTKVIIGVTAIAVTGAAVAGVNHLRNSSSGVPRPPQSTAPVVPGFADASDEPTAVSPSTSRSAEPEATESEATESEAPQNESPEPTSLTAPRKQTTTSPSPTDDGGSTPTHRPAPTATSGDEGDHHGDESHDPEPRTTASETIDHSAAPTSEQTSSPDPQPTPTSSSTGTGKGPAKGPGKSPDQGHDEK